MQKQSRTECILCGNSSYDVCFSSDAKSLSSTSGGIKREILRCNHCGLLQSRGLSNAALKSGARPVQTVADGWHQVGDVQSVTIPLGAVSPDFGKHEIAEINAFANPPGTFLNIGNDSMDILETARLKGWNSAAVAWIEEAPQDKNTTLLQRGLQKLRYDVVRLESSLEYTTEPIGFLQRISHVLRKDGLLVISTPDCSAWDIKLFSDGTYQIQHDIPCWFFTPRTMEQLLQKVGFKVLKVTNFTMQYGQPPTSVPNNIPGDAPQEEMTRPEISSMVRYFRVFARMQNAATQTRQHRINYNTQPQESEEEIATKSLIFIE